MAVTAYIERKPPSRKAVASSVRLPESFNREKTRPCTFGTHLRDSPEVFSTPGYANNACGSESFIENYSADIMCFSWSERNGVLTIAL